MASVVVAGQVAVCRRAVVEAFATTLRAPACRFHSAVGASLTEAQRVRTLRPAFWRARAMRLDEEDKARCLCRDPQAGLLAQELLSDSERRDLEEQPDADQEMVIAGIRSAFMDRFVVDALGRRVRHIVQLGAGMDSRPFRMDVPPQLTFTEVDAAPVLEAKHTVLHSAGQSGRCNVRQSALDIAVNPDASRKLADVLASVPASARRAGMLFLLDGSLEAWSPTARTAVLEVVAAAAPAGSMVVGPALDDELIELLAQGGFSQTNKVVAPQLRKIFGVAVPEGMSMLVAMRGEQQGPSRPQAEPLGGGSGGGRGREVAF